MIVSNNQNSSMNFGMAFKAPAKDSRKVLSNILQQYHKTEISKIKATADEGVKTLNGTKHYDLAFDHIYNGDDVQLVCLDKSGKPTGDTVKDFTVKIDKNISSEDFIDVLKEKVATLKQIDNAKIKKELIDKEKKEAIEGFFDTWG